MADLIAAVEKLLKVVQPGPGAAYTWVVEGYFADPAAPSGGMYIQMGVFKDAKKANEFVVELTKNFNAVDFLSFRARPMRPFRPFFDDAPTILLTDNKSFNEAAIRANETRVKQEERVKARDAALQLQETNEVKVGTPAHLTRLIHLCAQNSSQASFHKREAEDAEKSYTSRFAELKATLIEHPNVDWLGYITPILTRMEETTTLARLVTWWEKNKEQLAPHTTLPLPNEACKDDA